MPITSNPFRLLTNLYKKPPLIPAHVVQAKHLPKEEKQLLQRIGLTSADLRMDILEDTQVQWDRQNLYHQIDRASDHWLVSSALELYSDYSTTFSSLHNASVWVTSENPKYAKELNKFLQNVVGIEEKITDWASTTGGYGNLFIKVNGIPGIGITSIEDGEHPLNISRIDHEGILLGFYHTPIGQYTGEKKLLPPWDYVHFRLLGARKKRNPFGDSSYSEFRTMYLLSGMSSKQATTRYGTSLLINSLPVYRRLRLVEDSLLLARLTRGIIRYIWKLKVDSTNMEAVAEVVDQTATLLKRARAIDISSTSPNYDSKSNQMASVEDIFVPVWGDTGDLTFDKVGGEADIRWIVDVEELRNELACALRCPLSLLGGFVQEAAGSLGAQAIEKLDIRFARSARRLQRAIINGVTRLCQIHLAYINMDPDTTLFTVNMSETSTAEEEALKSSLDTGADVVSKMLDMLDGIEGIDKVSVINYLNQKILKLEDFELSNFMKQVGVSEEIIKESQKPKPERIEPVFNLDVLSYLPIEITEATQRNIQSWVALSRNKKVWNEKFGELKVQESKGDAPPENQGTFTW